MSLTLMRHSRRTALLSQQIRLETTLTNITQEDSVFRPPYAQYTKVIREAEKIVGYPTSFMNLRWLLSDEFANVAMHLRKVVGSNHPILHTAKNIIYNEQNNFQPWGLIILLLSKATRLPKAGIQLNSITDKQRILAEITEMIRTGHYIHRGLLNIPVEERSKNTETAMFGNKIAILIGDYLLVTANRMLADLRNQEISYLISTALRDISEGEFFGTRDKQNIPLPGKPTANIDEFHITADTLPLDVTNTLGSPLREWTLRTLYNSGSLFGRGCQGAMLLGGHNLQEQEVAYLLGCNICLAWQAAAEIKTVISDDKKSYSLVSAPVLFALNEKPNLYSLIESNINNSSDIDFDLLKEEILNTQAVERTKQLYMISLKKAVSYLDAFGDNECVDAIKTLIKTL